MGSVIIAMPNLNDAQKVSDILRSAGIATDAMCVLGSETLQRVRERDSGIVICTLKLKDMGYRELCEYIPEYFEILLIGNLSQEYDIPDRVVKLMSPFRKSDLVNTAEMMLSQLERRIKKKRSVPPKRSKEDRAIIDKAKMLLMDRNHMSEEESYRYIQKCSMDTGTNMIETAQMILLLGCDG